MTFAVDVYVSGIAALVQDERFPRFLRSTTRKAHRQAWEEWCRMRGNAKVGLRSRFGRGAWSRHNFTRRSYGYSRRQKRAWGHTRPYESPPQRVGSQLIEKPDFRSMRGMMKTEGIGWRVNLKNSSDEVQSILRLPGARALNFPQNDRYRREFLRITPITPDGRWLMDRIAELVEQAVEKKARATGRRRARKAA